MLAACNFEPRAQSDDSGVIDSPTADGPRSDADAADAKPDAAAPIAASCNALHTQDSSLPSGTYTIDPDGSGSDAPFTVTCDMQTEGGGWTIVFLPATSNLMSTPIAYTSASERLLTDASDVLMAYRTASGVAISSHATFPLPADWITSTPFDATSTDVLTNVSIDGASPVNALLRYGSESFTTTCYDPWVGAAWGRICILDTKAPFYTAFANSAGDTCSDSESAYDAVPCGPNMQFSLAVR
jgi:hypothetical protein